MTNAATEKTKMAIYSAYLSAFRLSEDLLIADSLSRYADRDVDWHIKQAEEKFDELTKRMKEMRAARLVNDEAAELRAEEEAA